MQADSGGATVGDLELLLPCRVGNPLRVASGVAELLELYSSAPPEVKQATRLLLSGMLGCTRRNAIVKGRAWVSRLQATGLVHPVLLEEAG